MVRARRLANMAAGVLAVGLVGLAHGIAVGVGEEDDIEGPRHPHKVPGIKIDSHYTDGESNGSFSPTLVSIISTVSAVSLPALRAPLRVLVVQFVVRRTWHNRDVDSLMNIALAMTFGGLVPFVPQYLIIRRTRSCDGFNTMVCWNLLAANLLRIMFWFGHPFELPLLAQSILMVGVMMILIHACVDLTFHPTPRKVTRLKGLGIFPIEEFWQWTDYTDYLQFVAQFTVVIGLITWLLLDVEIYIELLGFTAVFIEAVQLVPQLKRNHMTQSTEGLSITMMMCMLSGDSFKTGYYLLRDAPPQFALCALMQVSVDVTILWQVWVYRGKRPTATKIHPLHQT